MNRIAGILFHSLLWVTGAFVFYFLSYAPFLRCAVPNDPEELSLGYRSPRIYRLVEWATVHSPIQEPLLAWATFCGVRGPAEIQAWFYTQRINDPWNMDFNIQYDE